LSVIPDQQIEHDEQSRRFSGKSFHATRGRMNTLQQIIEGECPSARHDNFAIEHETLWLERSDANHQFREIAGQRLAGLRLQLDRRAIAKYQTAETVPFRLVLPVLALGNFIHGQGFHRGEWLVQGEGHLPVNAKRPAFGRPFQQVLYRAVIRRH